MYEFGEEKTSGYKTYVEPSGVNEELNQTSLRIVFSMMMNQERVGFSRLP